MKAKTLAVTLVSGVIILGGSIVGVSMTGNTQTIELKNEGIKMPHVRFAPDRSIQLNEVITITIDYPDTIKKFKISYDQGNLKAKYLFICKFGIQETFPRDTIHKNDTLFHP